MLLSLLSQEKSKLLLIGFRVIPNILKKISILSIWKLIWGALEDLAKVMYLMSKFKMHSQILISCLAEIYAQMKDTIILIILLSSYLHVKWILRDLKKAF